MIARPAYPPLSGSADGLARPALAAGRSELTPGYLVSSFELRAGLDIRALAVSSLPAEVLLEFQRLRRCWEA